MPKFVSNSISSFRSITFARTWEARRHRARGLELKRRGNIWGAFLELQKAYSKMPTADVSELLSHLIGTTSSYEDVTLAMSSEFDRTFYLNENKDVRDQGGHAETHYLLYGWKESRNPSAIFDHDFYRTQANGMCRGEFPLSHYVRQGKASGTPTNPVSNNLWLVPKAPADDAWDSIPFCDAGAHASTVVIIPVYKGYDETLLAIYQAIKSRGQSPYKVLVINDKSPDEALTLKLRDLARRRLFDYEENESNIGFVQTINKALTSAEGLDVILLNSDAYVFSGWYDRLVAHAATDPAVATVTPFSNNATICSYPLTNADNPLALEICPEQLDQLVSAHNIGGNDEIPTGVGFCLFVRRTVLDAIGPLDNVAFKLGYGEENDFCMRARKAGFKNLIAHDVFVYHSGSVSFSSAKHTNYEDGQAALARKHPDYPALIKHYIAADPILPARREIDLLRLLKRQSRGGRVAIATHALSGGVNTFVEQLSRRYLSEQKTVVILKFHDLCKVTIESSPLDRIFLPNLSAIDLRVEWDFFVSALERLQLHLYDVNSVAGLDWNWHKEMLSFFIQSGVAFRYTCHDYSAISHQYQLLPPDYNPLSGHGIVQRRRWLSMRETSASTDLCTPEERLDAYRAFLEAADEILVPSYAARAVLENEFPGIDFHVVPHDDHLPATPPATRRIADAEKRIAIVGAIGPHKGSDVVSALAADAKARGLPVTYVLIGYSDNDALLRGHGVTVTGKYYTEQEALDLLDLYQPDAVLIPSIWSETFCYALSLPLKKKIPAIVFDIGAQAERAKATPGNACIPLQLAADIRELSDTIIRLDLDELWRQLGH